MKSVLHQLFPADVDPQVVVNWTESCWFMYRQRGIAQSRLSFQAEPGPKGTLKVVCTLLPEEETP